MQKNKLPFVSYKLIEKIEKLNKSQKKEPVKTWSRASTIYPIMVGHTFLLHNGHKHIPLYVTNSMIGHKLGEFVFTRTFKSHKQSQAKIKKDLSLKRKK